MARLLVFADESSWHYRDLLRANRARFSIAAAHLGQLYGAIQPDPSLHPRSADPIGMIAIGGQPRQRLPADAALIRTLPVGSLQQVVLRMDLLSAWEQTGVAVINSAKSMECAVDKYLSLVRLAASKLPVPLTYVCQTIKQAAQAWDYLSGEVVLKPLFGSEGRGLLRFQSLAEATPLLTTMELNQQAIYLQQYIDHPGWDIRILVIGDQIFGMHRSGQGDWRNNASLGATIRAYEPTANEVEIARKAARAVGAVIAGVDLIYSRSGQQYVLEVNGAPGWRFLSQTTSVDIADIILTEVQNQLAGRSRFV